MTDKILFEKKHYPMSSQVSVLGEKLSVDEILAMWRAFDVLQEATKDVLMAPEMSERIERLQKERGILDYHIEIVSAIIREYFLGKKDSLWLENALMAKLDRKDVAFVKEYIQRNILTIKPAPKVSEEDVSVPAVQTASLPLLDAMVKYQRLSEQNITEDRIMVKGESQPVRGSLRNWVRHYRDNMGIRKHTAIERGQFLFQGENTRRLGAAEREKLSLVFRSLEENEPISIDTERQEIVFPAFEERPAPTVPKPATSPEIGTSFRPVEKFPVSTAPIKKALEWNASQPERAPLFGNVPLPPAPHMTKPRSVGVSAPVYAPPPETPDSGSPFVSNQNISFSSSHVLPHEKENEYRKESIQKTPAPEIPKGPEAISVITPRGGHFGFRGNSERKSESTTEDGFDTPRMVDLRNSGGKMSNDKL